MPTPPTLSISIDGLVTLLAQRLGINLSGVDFYTEAELTLYVQMAIREFQVLTGYWRQRSQIQTSATTTFYDMNTLVPGCSLNVLDMAILEQVALHLLETDGSQPNFVNTGQFTLANLAGALNQRIEDLLGRTHMVVSDYTSPVSVPPNGRLALSNGVLQIHRADWQDQNTGIWTLLSRSDEIGAYGFVPQWPVSPASPPSGYSVSVTPPFQMQFIPPPLTLGNLDLLVTQVNPYTYTGTPQTLGIPDDSTFALVWGILASVLCQDAQSRDYGRADYAAKRFTTAVDVLKNWPCLMQGDIAGNQFMPGTMHGLDHWQYGWRNQMPAMPSLVSIAGRNMICFASRADQAYNIDLDIIGNSPASGSSSATIDIPGDIITALLDNGQHLACFKEGGAEFTQTMQLYRNFIDVAQQYGSRLYAQSRTWEALRGVTAYENANRPYEVQESVNA